jgi:hypothetical protein
MAGKVGRASNIRDWIQTLLIGTGICVGFYQFEFKEIWAPAAAPINLTTEVNVAEAGFKRQGKQPSDSQLEAIELKVAARNPSGRDVWLLPTCWHAYGRKIAANNENNDWTSGITKTVEQHRPSDQGSYYKWNKPDVVAAGEVFPEDQILHPNEAITTSIVFYLPQDSYDLVRVHLELPTTPVANSAEVMWTVTPANGCEAQVYRKKLNGERGAEIRDFPKAYRDRTLQYQTATSTRELSLWKSGSSATASPQPAGFATPQ